MHSSYLILLYYKNKKIKKKKEIFERKNTWDIQIPVSSAVRVL
jgi:hypothetical protein